MTSDKELSIYFFGYLRASRRRLKFARHSSNVVFEGVCSKQSYCFAFDKASFYPRRMARGKMGILKGFRRLIVNLMSRIVSFMNSPLNTTVSRKVISFSDISAMNFIIGWSVLACSMISFTIAKGENVINVTFPFSWLGIVLLN